MAAASAPVGQMMNIGQQKRKAAQVPLALVDHERTFTGVGEIHKATVTKEWPDRLLGTSKPQDYNPQEEVGRPHPLTHSQPSMQRRQTACIPQSKAAFIAKKHYRAVKIKDNTKGTSFEVCPSGRVWQCEQWDRRLSWVFSQHSVRLCRTTFLAARCNWGASLKSKWKTLMSLGLSPTPRCW